MSLRHLHTCAPCVYFDLIHFCGSVFFEPGLRGQRVLLSAALCSTRGQQRPTSGLGPLGVFPDGLGHAHQQLPQPRRVHTTSGRLFLKHRSLFPPETENNGRTPQTVGPAVPLSSFQLQALESASLPKSQGCLPFLAWRPALGRSFRPRCQCLKTQPSLCAKRGFGPS